jgi:phosphate transport system substrate-binding protein
MAHAQKIGGELDPGLKRYQKGTVVSGKVLVGSAESMKRLVDVWGEAFRRNHKGITLDNQLILFSDATKAIAKEVEPIPQGADLVALSYPLTSAQLSDIAAKRGAPPVQVPVALDAVVLVVHHRNPLPGLTLGQVQRIFVKSPSDEAKLEQWHEVGLNSTFGSGHINRYGRDATSGTFAAFKEMALRGAEQRPDVFVQPGSMSVVVEVGSDEMGIGYAATGFAYRNKKVRMLPLARRPGEKFILPTNESVTSGEYPLSRQLYFYAMPEADGSLKPAIREFIAFVLSREGQQVVTEEGFIPLPAPTVEQALLKVDSREQVTSALDRSAEQGRKTRAD